MQFDNLAEMISFLLPAALAGMIGLMLSVAVVALIFSGRRISPALAVSGPGVTALGCAAVAFYASLAWTDPDGMVARQALVQASLTRAVAPFLVAGVSLPLAIAFAVEGARKTPREPLRAGIAGLGVVLVLAMMLGSVWTVEVNAFYAEVRALGYGLMGVTVVLAMLSGNAREGNGAEIGASASVMFAIMVAVGESSERALAKLLLAQGLDAQAGEERGLVVDLYLETIGAELPWMYGAVGFSGLFALIAIFWSARVGGRRGMASGMAILWVLSLVILWLAGDAGVATFQAVATRMP